MARTRPIRRFQAGTAIFFRIELRDATDDTLPLFASASVPTILIRDPTGTVQANFLGMTTTTDTGVYTYLHQTATTDPLGVWQVGFKVVDGTTTVYVPEADAFELIP
jgi:hypothetical protein